jgi:hypothetical protein
LSLLLRSQDARVRALVVEVAGTRELAPADAAELLQRGLEDNDPRVQEAALAAIEKRAGRAFPPAVRSEEARKSIDVWRTSPSTSPAHP